mmetsp:Transcript_35634/g.52085  ORF Transcript_35634/g.52085 Transcript_35634/m.52085 type:complete len:296 (-) Transcript_35634:647-1534(-)
MKSRVVSSTLALLHGHGHGARYSDPPNLSTDKKRWSCRFPIDTGSLVQSGALVLNSISTTVTASCEESEVSFNQEHYPQGLNAPFLNSDKDELLNTLGKLFWDPELRGIVRVARKLILSLGNLKGMSVADVGAGSGLLLRPLSHAVGTKGKVYALELSPAFAAFLEDEIQKEGLANAAVVRTSDASPGLPPASVDLALFCDVYHHLPRPLTYLRELHRALRPGGRLVLVEFYRDPRRVRGPPGAPSDWVLQHVRGDKPDFRYEIESCGFEHVYEVLIDDMHENYILVFQKKEQQE